MQRSFAFHISGFRFGFAMLAVYALVLQSIIILATPLPVNAQGLAVPLCTPGQTAPADKHWPQPVPRDPGSTHTCHCAFQCSAASALTPATVAAPEPVGPAAGISMAIASSDRHRGQFRERPRARGPPEGRQATS